MVMNPMIRFLFVASDFQYKESLFFLWTNSIHHKVHLELNDFYEVGFASFCFSFKCITSHAIRNVSR